MHRVLALFTSLALAACGGEVIAPAAEIAALREEHATPLSRAGCPGCPGDWLVEPCSFMETLRMPGSGAQAATCQTVSPGGDSRGLPDPIGATAQQRVTEAIQLAGTSPSDALRLFALGGDLQRLAEPLLWKLGLEAQARALDALEAAPPQGAWPADLMEMARNMLPPVRITDVVLVYKLSQARPLTYDELRGLREASTMALNAVRTEGEERRSWVAQFSASVDAPYDLMAAWRQGEQLRERAMRVAMDGALRALVASRGSCPASLDALSPRPFDRIPPGWTLDRETCAPKKQTPSPGQDGEAG